MSVKKFKFVSPGIFLNEIDNSQLPKAPAEMGPVVIGRAERGPGLVPTKVDSFSEFVETFGMPVPGGKGGDVWREGNRLGPTYGAYAAQAYLRNSGPLTYVRLLGADHDDYSASATRAGWKVSGTLGTNVNANAAAYGLFVADFAGVTNATASLTMGGTYARLLDHGTANGAVDSEISYKADGSSDTIKFREGTSMNAWGVIYEAGGTYGGDGNLILSCSAGEDTINLRAGAWSAANIVTDINASASHFGAVVGTTFVHTTNGLGNSLTGGTGGSAAHDEADAIGTMSPSSGYVVIYQKSSSTAGQLDASGKVEIKGSKAFKMEFKGFTARGTPAFGGAAISTSYQDFSVNAATPDNTWVWFEADASAATNAALATHIAKQIVSGSAAASDSSAYMLGASAADAVVTVTNKFIPGAAGVASSISEDINSMTVVDFSSDGLATGPVAASGSAQDLGDAHLAAVIYADEGALTLVGNDLAGVARDGAGMWIQSDGSDYEFKLRVRNKSDVVQDTISFNMAPASKKYARKVLNTNPTLCNDTITNSAQVKTFWLGETFDQYLGHSLSATTAAGSQMAALVPLKQMASSGADQSDNRVSARPAQSGWVVSQHLGSGSLFVPDSDGEYPVTKLMKFHGLYSGEWEQQNLKISIEDIKASTNEFEPYGSFSIVVRRANDKDNAPRIVERFSSCNLNPNSENYVARKVGDMYSTWDYSEGRFKTYGRFNNQSRFFRMEMNEDVDTGVTDPSLLPFGYYGKARWKSATVGDPTSLTSTPAAVAAASGDIHTVGTSSQVTQPFAYGDEYSYYWGIATGTARGSATDVLISASADTATWKARQGDIWAGNIPGAHIDLHFPKYQLRVSSSQGDVSNPKDAYWGLMTSKTGSARHDVSYEDLGRPWSTTNEVGTGAWTVTENQTEYGEFFSLDDVRLVAGSTTHASWANGNRSGGHSLTAVSGTYNQVLSSGFDRFTMPVWGGCDGLDIMEQEPFRNTGLSGQSSLTHYAYNSIKRAVDSVADPEVVECNLMAMPGITNPGLTEHMINACENRADALAIIDLQNDYVPSTEGTDSEANRLPSVSSAVSSLQDRGLNSSYGCAYFPWVQIRDQDQNSLLWAPPSIVALGTMSSSQRKTEVWFAPAGFTRGGLTEGAAGIPVLNVRHRLNSKERDLLYEANINPIAQFPAEGIVVFGQKTLQVTQSALDRINVRRLMIFIKKQVSRMAATVLFDQNVQTTWSRFTSRVKPFLASVQSRFGLTEFRVILDETTTTPELIDRNIMYAKILLKPARAIEFIAIDFVITDSGASFDD